MQPKLRVALGWLAVALGFFVGLFALARLGCCGSHLATMTQAGFCDGSPLREAAFWEWAFWLVPSLHRVTQGVLESFS
jgi:hypothetical protein